MNRQEITIVVLLFMALVAWFVFLKPAPPAQPPEGATEGATNGVSRVESGGGASGDSIAADTNKVTQPPETGAVDTTPPKAAVDTGDEGHAAKKLIVVLSNDVAQIRVSTWGGAIESVALSEYYETAKGSQTNGPRVNLDFAVRPALSLEGIPGLSTNNDFQVSLSDDGRSVIVSRQTREGLLFERTITATNGHCLFVTDSFKNTGAEAIDLPDHRVAVGPMNIIKSKAKTRGMYALGIDTLRDGGGEKAEYWAKKRLPALFGHKTGFMGCGGTPATQLKHSASDNLGGPLLWVAAKNKFFVEIFAPDGGAQDCEVYAERDLAASNQFVMGSVSAGAMFDTHEIKSGEAYVRKGTLYIGPKKYTTLKALGLQQDEVMQFGMFHWICKPLLRMLNFFYGLVKPVMPYHGYGIAIILVTVIVRLVFWPITHKSTESMQKMQKLQPEMKKLQEKHKDNPQKLNREVMLLYKKHNVNPVMMMGCLPMLLQIPVFFALFTVLRSAVELRFARFLWIADLSEPEMLLAGKIPMIPTNSLNILPLFMTATMLLQQNLTPSTGDPQQKKMMMMMPVIFLFILYSMPSALVLYWSISQSLAIVQLLLQRRKTAAAEAVA